MMSPSGNGNNQQQPGGSNANANNPFPDFPDGDNLLNTQSGMFSLMGKMMDGTMKFMEQQGNKMDEHMMRQEARQAERMDGMRRRMQEQQDRDMAEMRERHNAFRNGRQTFGSHSPPRQPAPSHNTGPQTQQWDASYARSEPGFRQNFRAEGQTKHQSSHSKS
mmetsp:Transcript_6763/g.9871  ORF Transcript_6763/g.9871 Transcript_6763/m.9871 type:complete len:163 (+) Transcript_6763:84-572(+)|eukprot:CAMPEP_0194235904 /NCGR_PEP_ID=MMETSP0158-20130606/3276_1 /TAXON_ID=33649 /ORGANISM="Thalassionema nitzschioides, Strain L26-B" /LENGTH=162 /DNA_ID=CAMNT_0038969501 /DNA_START=32 /DNA_END=520 /DNA_ORIENTATION=-